MRSRSIPSPLRTALIGLRAFEPPRKLAKAPASCRASGAERLVIELPNNTRDKTSSSGSAGFEPKAITGRSAVPVTLSLAVKLELVFSAVMVMAGSGGELPEKRMSPLVSAKRLPAKSYLTRPGTKC